MFLKWLCEKIVDYIIYDCVDVEITYSIYSRRAKVQRQAINFDQNLTKKTNFLHNLL